MRLIIVSPGLDLPEILALKLLESGTDLSRSLVIFPEKRPGHYLRKALARRLKKSYLPPVIQSFDEFTDTLHLELSNQQTRPADPVDAVSILYQLHRQHPGPLGGQSFLTLDEFFPLGLKLYRDLEALKSGEVSRENFLMIDSLTGQNLPEKTRARLQKVSFFYENFYRQLEREKLSTRASRLIEVVENLTPELLERYEQVILAGFYLLTAAENRLLKKIMESERSTIYLLEGPGLEEIVSSFGLNLQDAEKISGQSGQIPEPDISFYLSPDSHGQFFILNNLIAEKSNNPERLTEKQVIVLPALDSLIPLHQQTLSALPPEAYNISLGYPLTRTPLYNFFDCLFNLIQTADDQDRVYAPHYLDFVLHPYTKNIYFPAPFQSAELTRILFHTIQEILNQKKGNLFWSLEDIASDPDLHSRLEEHARTGETPRAPEFLRHLKSIHEQTIVPFLRLESIRDFAVKLIELLNFLIDHSTAPQHLFFQPYAEAFFEQFEKLKKCLMSSGQFENRNSYFNLFRQIIPGARVSFPGTPLHGLQVLGFWETRCLQFDEVYILDMNEEVMPGTSKVDSLLPQMVRRALQLPIYQDLEKRYRYYLSHLLSGAKKVHLFFVENSEKEKSRFVEELLWERQKKEKQPESSGYIKSASYRIALHSPEVRPVPKTEKTLRILEEMEISATQLDSYLQCPLQFYYAHLLKLSEKEEISDTLERADIGTLVHHILNFYFQEHLNRPLPEKLDKDRLLQITEDVFRRKFSDPDSGSLLLIKDQITDHLVEFLQCYQEPVVRRLKTEGFSPVILRLESRFQRLYEVKGKKFRLKGKIDRVEKRGNRLCLLDYKTSASSKYQAIKLKKLNLEDRASWSKAIGSLQLPFYQLLAAGEFQVPAEDIYSALLMLGQNYLSPEIEYSPFSDKKSKKSGDGHLAFSPDVFPLGETEETLAAREEKFLIIMEVIDLLLLEIVDPARPFTPDGLTNGQCRRCIFTDFCGQ